jgi:hypothetical protein
MSAGWIVGDRARITATWTRDGQPIDPGAVSATVRSPGGVVTTLALTTPAVGVRQILLDLVDPGRWHVYVSSIGSVMAAEAARLDVEAKPIP